MGKTFSLKKYAQMPRVAYVECNEAMNQKDLIRRLEAALGLPHEYGTIAERLERVADFLTTASGYLLIIDEADKLITKYTQKRSSCSVRSRISRKAASGLSLPGSRCWRDF